VAAVRRRRVSRSVPAATPPWLDLLPDTPRCSVPRQFTPTSTSLAASPIDGWPRFPALYEKMLSHASTLGSEELARLARRSRNASASCSRARRAWHPETIQHDDLHGSNIYRREGQLRILDWAMPASRIRSHALCHLRAPLPAAR